MRNRRNKVLIGAIVTAGIIISTIIVLRIINFQYSKNIPLVPGSPVLTTTVMEQIQDAYRVARRQPSDNNLGELGMIYHASAQYDQALQCYRLAVKKNRSEWKWSYYLGYLYRELGMPGDVIESFTRVTELNPGVDLAWYYLGEAYQNLGNKDSAEKAFSVIINKNIVPPAAGDLRQDHFPLSVYVLFQLSKIYFDSGHLELAENTLIKLLNQSDGYGPAYRLLGNIHRMKGDAVRGEEYIARANDLFLYAPPVDTLVDKLALLSRSERYLLKKIDEAKFSGYTAWKITLVNQGMKYMPGNKDLISKAIKIYLSENIQDSAVRLKDQHIRLFIDNYSELVSVGMLFYQKGMYEISKDYWEQAFRLDSENADIYKHLALCSWELGETQQARDLIGMAIEKYQDQPGILAELIFASLPFETMEKTNEYLRKLNRLSSRDPKVLKLYGRISELSNQSEAAISFYQASFNRDPKDVGTIHYLGDLFIQKEMWEPYMQLYYEAVKNHPNDPEILENIGAFLIQCPDQSFRDIDAGIKYLIRAFSHKNSPPSVVLSSGKHLAIALARKGDKINSIKTIQRTIDFSRRENTSEEIKQELEQLLNTIRES